MSITSHINTRKWLTLAFVLFFVNNCFPSNIFEVFPNYGEEEIKLRVTNFIGENVHIYLLEENVNTDFILVPGVFTVDNDHYIDFSYSTFTNENVNNFKIKIITFNTVTNEEEDLFSNEVSTNFGIYWPVSVNTGEGKNILNNFLQLYTHGNYQTQGKYVFHSGLDILGEISEYGEAVVFPFSGEIERVINLFNCKDQGFDIKVLINNEFVIIELNHIVNALNPEGGFPYTLGNNISAGTLAGNIITCFSPTWTQQTHHVHVSVIDYDTFDSNWKSNNPLNYLTANDPYTQECSVSNINSKPGAITFKKGQNLTNIYEKDYFPSNTVNGSVDIIAECSDKQNAYANLINTPLNAGYFVQNYNYDDQINSNVIKNANAPYLLFDHRQAITNNSGGIIMDDNFTSNPTQIKVSALIDKNPILSFSVPDITFKYNYSFNLTNTNATNGQIENLDANQCWATDVKKNNSLNGTNGYSANYTKARNIDEAQFPDGKYKVNVMLEDYAHPLEVKGTQDVVIDNFRPYVKQLLVKAIPSTGNQRELYRAMWQWQGSNLVLTPMAWGDGLGNNSNKRLKDILQNGEAVRIEISFSEMIDIANGFEVVLFCGSNQSVLLNSGNSTISTITSTVVDGLPCFTYVYQVNNTVFSNQLDSEETISITIKAKDIAGSDLLGFPNNITYQQYQDGVNQFIASQIPKKKYEGGSFSYLNNDIFSNLTTDFAHKFKRAQDCSPGGGAENESVVCPLADFAAEVTIINVGESVTFINQSVSLYNGYTWTFGDGNTGTTTNSNATITHTYLTPGLYTVKLSGNGPSSSGGSQVYERTITQYVLVNAVTNSGNGGNPIPSLEADFYFTPSSTADVGEQVYLTFTGGGGTPPYTFNWTFQNGNPSTSTSENPATIFTTSGTKTIVLTLTDANGLTASHTDYIVIESTEPTPAFNIPSDGDCITLVPNLNSNSYNLGQLISFVPAPLNVYSGIYNYQWDFRDDNTASGYNVTHVYNTEGEYDVSLVLTSNTTNVPIGPACTIHVSISNQYAISDLSISCTNTSRTLPSQTEPFHLVANYSGGSSNPPHIYYWTFTNQTPNSIPLSFTSTTNSIDVPVGLWPTTLTPNSDGSACAWSVHVEAHNGYNTIEADRSQFLTVANDVQTTSGPLQIGNVISYSGCYSPEDDESIPRREGFELAVPPVENTYPSAGIYECYCTDITNNNQIIAASPLTFFSLPTGVNPNMVDYSFDNTIGHIPNWQAYINNPCTRNRGFARVLIDNINLPNTFPKTISGKVSMSECVSGILSQQGDPNSTIEREFSIQLYKCLKSTDINLTSNVSLCPGSIYNINATVAAKSRPPYSFEWSSITPNAMAYMSDSHILDPTISFPASFTGDVTYTLTVHSAEMYGSFSASDPHKSITFHLNNITVVTVDNPESDFLRVCLGNSIELPCTSTGGSGNLGNNYLWLSAVNISASNPSLNVSPAINLDDPHLRNPNFTPTSTGEYKFMVLVSSPNSQCANLNTVTIVVDNNTRPISAGNDIITCPGKSVNLLASIAPANLPENLVFQYRWFPSGTEPSDFISTPLCLTFQEFQTAPYQTVEYTVETMQLNGCSATDQIVVFVDETVGPQVILPTDQVMCYGTSELLLEPQVESAFPLVSQTWSWQTSAYSIPTQQAIPPIQSWLNMYITYNDVFESTYPSPHERVYTYDLVDDQGCHNSNRYSTISVKANTRLTFSATSGFSGCFYNDGIYPNLFADFNLTGGTHPYMEYKWYKDGVFFSNSQLLPTSDIHETGIYNLQVKDNANCLSGFSPPIILNLLEKNPTPTNFNLPLEVCKDNEVTLYFNPYLGNGEMCGSNLKFRCLNCGNDFDIIGQNPASLNNRLKITGRQVGNFNLNIRFYFSENGSPPLSDEADVPSSWYDISVPITITPDAPTHIMQADICDDITTNNISSNTMEAVDIISCSNSDVLISANSGGRFIAKNSIRLLPGFKAEAGSDFIAKINECIIFQSGRTSDPSENPPPPTRESPKNKDPKHDIFTYFPNPTSDVVHYSLELTEEKDFSIELLDLTGRNVKTIYKGKAKSINKIFDMSEYAPGSYNIKLNIESSTLPKKIHRLIKAVN